MPADFFGLAVESLTPTIGKRLLRGLGTINKRNGIRTMSDATVAEIARRLADAMMKRARTRQPEDSKAVQQIQTELVAEVAAERNE